MGFALKNAAMERVREGKGKREINKVKTKKKHTVLNALDRPFLDDGLTIGKKEKEGR